MDQQELMSLIGDACEDQLTEGQMARLQSLLSEDAEARRVYLQCMHAHGLLERFDLARPDEQAVASTASETTESSQSGWINQQPLSPLLGFLVRSLPKEILPSQHPVRFWIVSSLLTAVFCSVLVSIIVFHIWRGTGFLPWNSDFVATITHADKAIWAEDQTGVELGSQLVAGHRLELDQGRIHLLFRDGARVAVEGPASLSVNTSGMMTLDAGRLLARVSRPAVGFTVATSFVDFVDLGTEFGIHVVEEEAEIEVFEGKVQARLLDAIDEKAHTLTAGEAAVFGNPPQQGFYVKEKKMNRAIYLGLATMLAASTPRAADAVPIAPVLRLDASTFTSAVAQLDTWTDSSGNGHDAIGSGSTRPEVVLGGIGGKPVVRIDSAANEFMSISHSFQSGSVFVVASYDTSTFTNFSGLFNGDSGSGNDDLYFTGSSGNSEWHGTTQLDSRYVNGVLSGIAIPTLNQANLYSGTDSTPQTLSGWVLARDRNFTTLRSWDGDIAEVIVYDTALGSFDRQGVEVFLDEKWNLGLGLRSAYGSGTFNEDLVELGLAAEITESSASVPELSTGILFGVGGMLVLGFGHKRRCRRIAGCHWLRQ